MGYLTTRRHELGNGRRIYRKQRLFMISSRSLSVVVFAEKETVYETMRLLPRQMGRKEANHSHN